MSLARYPQAHPLVAAFDLPSGDRDTLHVGEEVIVSVNYGKHRLRLTVEKRTDKQVTLSNGTRYSLKTGRKIGAAESWDSPYILGRPRHSRPEAEALAAKISDAADKAARNAELVDLYDRIKAYAEKDNTSVPHVLARLGNIHLGRVDRQQESGR